jgi:hypothetical protein
MVTMMAWSFPAHDGQPAKEKTEYETVIERLAQVAAKITEGTGDQVALKRERAELIRRFYELKDFKLPD